MAAVRNIKILLSAIIGLFAAATVYTAILIGERQEALRVASRYNVAWLASQATTEFARFVERATAVSLPGARVDADEVQLRYDILLNRVGLFEDGDFKAFVESDPELRETVRLYAEILTRIESLVAQVDKPGVPLSLREVLTPFEGRLARLAAAANRYSGDRAAADQQELLQLHRGFSGLAIGLIVCGFGLMAIILWHNRLLAGAHRNLNGLAQDLRHTSGQLNAALNNMSQGLCMVDREQRLTVCNERLLTLLDLPQDRTVPGRPIAEILEASPHFAAISDLGRLPHQTLIEGGRAGSYLHESGDGRILSVSHQPLQDGGWVATWEDITERRRAEAKIAHLAHHDVLTGLANRAQFLSRLDEALHQLGASGETVAVLSLDLDRFKSVNDTLGHPMGDQLLCQLAARLVGTTRETDLVARFGGDEFAILQVGREQPREADALARRIAAAVATPFDLDGTEVVIGTSIGISVAPLDGTGGDELLKNADMALYRGKAEGRGTHRFFEPEMDAQLQARRALELDLRLALARDEFDLHYQALVNLRSGAVVGYEALLRWHHPERGSVSPAVFVPVAEDIGLIGPMGAWAIRRACREAASWPGDLKVAVNLSSVQFRSRGLVETVVGALASASLSPRRLELEITETVLLDNNDATLETLHQLRGLGVQIALDDFGTGFASLSYLRNFPFDKIKIDRSFVSDTERSDCAAIVRSIASLAANLGMSTTAEGIETHEQFARVRDAGCTEGQGFLFARPKPAAELTHVTDIVPPRPDEARAA